MVYALFVNHQCVLSLGLGVFKWDAFLSLYQWVLALSGVYHGYSVHACCVIACYVTNEDRFWKGWRTMRELNSRYLRYLKHGFETVHGFRVLLVPTLQPGRWQMVLNWPHVIEHCLLDNLKQGLQIVPLLTNGWLTSLVAWEAIYCLNLPHFHVMLENCCHVTPLNGLLLHLLKTASGTEAQNSSAPTRMPSYKPEHGGQTSYVFCTLILPSSKSKNI